MNIICSRGDDKTLWIAYKTNMIAQPKCPTNNCVHSKLLENADSLLHLTYMIIIIHDLYITTMCPIVLRLCILPSECSLKDR